VPKANLERNLESKDLARYWVAQAVDDMLALPANRYGSHAKPNA
jgi:hypothetical protein